jgi:hypothetical protein
MDTRKTLVYHFVVRCYARKAWSYTSPNPCISHGLNFYSRRGAEAFRGLGDNLKLWRFLEDKELSGRRSLFSVPSVPLCENIHLCVLKSLCDSA